MISKASAPGKVILFGEHFVVHGTKAILAAIDRRVTVTSETVNEPVISVSSRLGRCEVGTSGEGGPADPRLEPFVFLARRAAEYYGHGGGIRISIDSEIPPGTGLGSSSASCVAAAASVSGLFARVTRDEACRLAVEAERTIFERTSGADCAVCTGGGVILYDRDSGPENIESGSGLCVIVSDSGMAHSTDRVVSRVSSFRDINLQRFEDLCRRESALIETARARLRDGDLAALGESMKQNQRYLEEIGVSNEVLGRIVRVADSLGLGSKITGAGGGGCVISVSDEDGAGRAIESLRQNGIESFAARIDYAGLETF